ncbi:MAG TPA: hypothetical protein V6C72_18385 [Chroococcales cyanobacterium]
MQLRQYHRVSSIKLRLIAALLVACLALSIKVNLPARAISKDIPQGTVTAPELVKEESVSTYIPSESAPGDGIAVNIIIPEKPRYKDGAPVVVVVPGGDGPNGLTFTMHSAQVGCLEVRLAFPGGGVKGFMSSGIADYRGVESQVALKDVLLFAAGKSTDNKGRHINDLVPMKVMTSDLGIVGWSNGGNIALVTMARFADQLGFISWLTFYESPVGTFFFPPNLGGVADLLLNNHYRQGSAASGKPLLDFNGLSWQEDMSRNPGVHKRQGEPELKGVIFYDDNHNHHWDESTEYAYSYLMDVGLEKQIYPMEILQYFDVKGSFVGMEEVKERPKPGEKPPKLKRGEKPKPKPVKMRKVLKWPAVLATPREAEAYYQRRDGSLYVGQICSKYPDLMVTIVGTQIDHLQKQPDHPHIIYLYNAFLSNKLHWLRMNPEATYVSAIAQMHAANFINNKPNESLDASTIADFMEPEGVTKDYVFMEAAVAELCDRRRSKNLKSPLEQVIYTYTNSKAKPPPVKKGESTPGSASPKQ